MVKKALGVEEKDKDKDEKKGGFFSFGGSKKDEDDGGVLSFGDKKKDDDEGGFFSNIFNKDKDDDREKKSGFQGLFSEQEGVSAGGEDGDSAGGGGDFQGQSAGISDGGTSGGATAPKHNTYQRYPGNRSMVLSTFTVLHLTGKYCPLIHLCSLVRVPECCVALI